MIDNNYIKWDTFKSCCSSITIEEYLMKKGCPYRRMGAQINGVDPGDGEMHNSLSIKADGSEVFNWFSKGISGKGIIGFVSKIILGEVNGNRSPSSNDIEQEIFDTIGRSDSRFPMSNGMETAVRNRPAVQTVYQPFDWDNRNPDFELPKRASENIHAIKYLCEERMLDREVVDYFIQRGDIYECETESPSGRVFRNVAFVGKSKDGEPRACEVKYFKPYTDKFGKIRKSKSVKGSNKAYTFSYVPDQASSVRCFEATVDALSWLSLHKMLMGGDGWKECAVLVTEGVGEKMLFPPIALVRVLNHYPNLSQVITCFDSDKVGLGAARSLRTLLESPYGSVWENPNGSEHRVVNGVTVTAYGNPILTETVNTRSEFAPYDDCKDWNDTLKKCIRLSRAKSLSE